MCFKMGMLYFLTLNSYIYKMHLLNVQFQA